MLLIEVKSEKGKVSVEQAATLTEFAKAGALCVVARHPKDVRDALEAAGVKLLF